MDELRPNVCALGRRPCSLSESGSRHKERGHCIARNASPRRAVQRTTVRAPCWRTHATRGPVTAIPGIFLSDGYFCLLKTPSRLTFSCGFKRRFLPKICIPERCGGCPTYAISSSVLVGNKNCCQRAHQSSCSL